MKPIGKLIPILEGQIALEIESPKWWHVRYDFGIYSRYTRSFHDDTKPNIATALLYLGILMEKNDEIKKLFDENGLKSFEVSESQAPEEKEDILGIIS